IDWPRVLGARPGTNVPLPTQAFVRRRHWRSSLAPKKSQMADFAADRGVDRDGSASVSAMRGQLTSFAELARQQLEAFKRRALDS
ncbi:MAG: hypothetical protein KC431_12825, partial [Myxococcales bacterium]|nr:hypothetical protein [Myxococcales bacterium]